MFLLVDALEEKFKDRPVEYFIISQTGDVTDQIQGGQLLKVFRNEHERPLHPLRHQTFQQPVQMWVNDCWREEPQKDEGGYRLPFQVLLVGWVVR